MSTTETLKLEVFQSSLIALINEDNLADLFAALNKGLDKNSESFKKHLLLNRRYASLVNDNELGKITSEEYRVECTRVTKGLIRLIYDIKNIDLASDSDSKISSPNNLYVEIFNLHGRQENEIKRRGFLLIVLLIIILIMVGIILRIKSERGLIDRQTDPVDMEEAQMAILESNLRSIFKDKIEIDVLSGPVAYVSDYHPFTKDNIDTVIARLDTGNVVQDTIYEERPFIVYALDSHYYTELVYDTIRYSYGGTNADEIMSILAKKRGVLLYSDEVSPSWSGEQRVSQVKPDLIIIHFSAFERHSKDNKYGLETLKSKLTSLNRMSPSTRFLVYSRGPEFRKELFTSKSDPYFDKLYTIQIKGEKGKKSLMLTSNRTAIKNVVDTIMKEVGAQ